MLIINFLNVEKLIFEDSDLQGMLPSFMFSYFEQWKLGKRVPMLKQTGRQAMLDILEVLGEATEVLEEYFGETVIVESLNYHAVWNLTIPLDDEKRCCEQLCQLEGCPNFTTWMDDKHLYVSLWQ